MVRTVSPVSGEVITAFDFTVCNELAVVFSHSSDRISGAAEEHLMRSNWDETDDSTNYQRKESRRRMPLANQWLRKCPRSSDLGSDRSKCAPATADSHQKRKPSGFEFFLTARYIKADAQPLSFIAFFASQAPRSRRLERRWTDNARTCMENNCITLTILQYRIKAILSAQFNTDYRYVCRMTHPCTNYPPRFNCGLERLPVGSETFANACLICVTAVRMPHLSYSAGSMLDYHWAYSD